MREFVKIRVSGENAESAAIRIAAKLVEASSAFRFDPLPDGEYRLEVRPDMLGRVVAMLTVAMLTAESRGSTVVKSEEQI